MFLQNNDQGQKIGMSRSQVIYKWYQFITGPLFVSFDQLSGKSIFYYSLIFFLSFTWSGPKCIWWFSHIFWKMYEIRIWEISAPVSFLYLLKIWITVLIYYQFPEISCNRTGLFWSEWSELLLSFTLFSYRVIFSNRILIFFYSLFLELEKN